MCVCIYIYIYIYICIQYYKGESKFSNILVHTCLWLGSIVVVDTLTLCIASFHVGFKSHTDECTTVSIRNLSFTSSK